MTDRITIQRRSNHRVGVFADIQNMYHSAKNLYHARVNFAELLKTAVGDRQLVRALAYVVKGGETEEEQSFFDALHKSGFELKMKDLQVFAGGAKKADWDVGLAVDAIGMSKQLDVVVLISGDGDFVPLVQYLQFLGLIVEVVSFGRSTSLKLKETTNNFMDLDENKKVLLRPGALRRRGGGRGTGRKKTASEEQNTPQAQPPKGEFMPPRNRSSS
ncbi:MAG TPA: NYN domain-containing protein [Candidatus Paceibacterota bacterium]|nr:NYN domain-containing protein [Candidatus Paceibacterota bacterium]